MKPRCQELESSWDLYLDGRLDPVRAAEVRDHLRDCVACRQELGAERELRRTLGTLPICRLPEHLAGEIARIPDTGSGPVGRPSWWQHLTRRLWPAQEQARETPSGPRAERPLGPTIRWPVLAASLAIATFLLLSIAPPHEGQDKGGYSDQAVLLAKAQATWCLALTARVLKESEKQAVNEVFVDKLPRAVRSTLLRPTDDKEGGQG